MDDERNLFHKFSSFMDQNIRGVQYAIYSVAGLGLIFALRSVRPFAKFSLPSDIPQHFIEKKISFKANVNLVQPGKTHGMNPLLLVDHHPLISLAKKSKINDGLPLEIASVNITNNGFIWLQNLLRGQEIKFVPLKISTDRVHSIVYTEKQNVGEQLVKIGFAVVSPIDDQLQKDDFYLKYYKNLLRAEKKAEWKGAGLWADGKVSYFKLMMNRIRSLLTFSLAAK